MDGLDSQSMDSSGTGNSKLLCGAAMAPDELVPSLMYVCMYTGPGTLGVIHESGWEATSSGASKPCNYYGIDGGDCVPEHSAVVYLVTGVAGMALLVALTLFFICCLCVRRRRRQQQQQQAEASFLRWHEVQVVRYPGVGGATAGGGGGFPFPGGNFHSHIAVGMMNLGPGGPSTPTAAAAAAEDGDGKKSPSVCVIMAGEDKPTFLAHPVGGDLPASGGPKEEDAEEGAQAGNKPAS